VRWYLDYNLSLRDLEEMMAERGGSLSIDGTSLGGLIFATVAAEVQCAHPLSGPAQPISEQLHRAGPPPDQTTHSAYNGVQVNCHSKRHLAQLAD
jgi:hypothetical protein